MVEQTSMKKRKSLGRGLSVLLADSHEEYNDIDIKEKREIRSVPINALMPGEYQPRQKMNEEDINALADSIRKHGVLQPIIIRELKNKTASEHQYEIVAGERRWRAAIEAKMTEVPVILKELSNKETLEIALVENLQRRNLNILEEADGYKRLIDDFSYTQEEMAKVFGKSRSYITNTLRLLGLADDLKILVENGELTAGHARALLPLENYKKIVAKILKNRLNVRQTESLVKKELERLEKGPSQDISQTLSNARDKKDLLKIENDLSKMLNLKVKISLRGQKGSIKISYDNLLQLDDLLKSLTKYN